MNQSDIRDYNGQQFTVAEGAALVKELNDRTEHPDVDYNSIAQLGIKVKALEETLTPSEKQIFFGVGAFDNTAGDTTTALELIAQINTVGFTITQGQSVIFNIKVKRQVNGNAALVEELYRFTKNNQAGTYGTVSTFGNISFSDLIFINSKVISNIVTASLYIYLGDITPALIQDHVNQLVNTISMASGTDYFYISVINGEEQTHKYDGVLPRVVGVGQPSTIAADFDLTASEAPNATTPTEEQIIGSVSENLTATGAVPINFDAISHSRYLQTGNVVFTDNTAVPAASKGFAKNMTLDFTLGTESTTLPVAWILIGTIDVTKTNILSVIYANFTSGLKIYCFISNTP